MMKISFKHAALLGTVSVLAGCTQSPIYKQANAYTNKVDKTIQANQKDLLKNIGAQQVTASDKPYVNVKPVYHQPVWLTKRVVFNGRAPFAVILKQILAKTGRSFYLYDSVNPNKAIQFTFDGSVKEALDALQEKTGYHYEIEGKSIAWSQTVTKTFQVNIMPGSNNFDLGGSSVDSSGQGSSSKQGGQFSTLSGQLSIWKDIRDEIPNLLSKQGKYAVSESDSSVTVTDKWENIKAVKKYIKKLNASLGKEVSIQVQILQVQLNKQFQRGINWKKIAIAGVGSFSLGGDLMEPISLMTNGSASASSFTANLNPGGTFGGSQAMIKALSSQGRVSVVNRPLITTLNNQVAEIQQVKDQAYVKEVSVTSNGANSGGSQQSISPGNIKTGLRLYVLPKIKGGKVYLQISAILSTLNQLQVYNVATGSSTNSDDKSAGGSDSQMTVQLPTVSSKRFNQRSVLNDGQTLVVAGFNGRVNMTGKSSNFGLSNAGSGLSNHTQTVLLITPHIVNLKK